MDCFNVRLFCPGCHRNFNEDDRCPRVVPECGHSVCQHCLKVRLRTAYTQNATHILCWVCQASQRIELVFADSVQLFPRNFFGLDLLRTFGRNVRCRHPEKKKFQCFSAGCCQRSRFCLHCYFAVHFDCNPQLILRTKDAPARLVVLRDHPQVARVRELLGRARAWPVTSNRPFLEALVDDLAGRLDWMERVMASFPVDSELAAHLFAAAPDPDGRRVVCRPDPAVLGPLVGDLEELLANGELLSTLQFFFALAVAAFRATAAVEDRPANPFKKLHVPLGSLESVQLRRSHFSENKADPRVVAFKEENAALFRALAFRDFAQESVFFEKCLNQSIEEARAELRAANDKLAVLEPLLKDSIDRVRAGVDAAFRPVPGKLLFRYSHFHRLEKGAHDPSTPLLQVDETVRGIVATQLLQAEFYLTEEDVERLEAELRPLPAELRAVILEVVRDVADECLYNSERRASEQSHLGVFACQRDGRAFLNSYFKRKVSLAHVNEVRGYLRQFNEEVTLGVVQRLMVHVMIPVTSAQVQQLRQVRDAPGVRGSLRDVLDAGQVFALPPDARAALAAQLEDVFQANRKNFERFFAAFEHKREVLRRLDALNDKLAFELLALEFFGVFKQ